MVEGLVVLRRRGGVFLLFAGLKSLTVGGADAEMCGNDSCTLRTTKMCYSVDDASARGWVLPTSLVRVMAGGWSLRIHEAASMLSVPRTGRSLSACTLRGTELAFGRGDNQRPF